MLCLLMSLIALGVSLPVTCSLSVPDKSNTPQVYLYPPHPDEMRLGLEDLTLTCLVKGLDPDLFDDASWLQNNEAISEDNYVNTPIVKDSNKETHFMYSKLNIKTDSWVRGEEYTCMVVSRTVIQASVKKSQEEE